MNALNAPEKDQAPDPAYLIAAEVHPRWVALAEQRDAISMAITNHHPKYEGQRYDFTDPVDRASWQALMEADDLNAPDTPGARTLWIRHVWSGVDRGDFVSMWGVPFDLTPHRLQLQNINSSQQALDRIRAAAEQGVDYTTPEWQAVQAFDLYVNYVVMNDPALQKQGVTLEAALQDADLVARLRQQYDAMDPITRQMDDLFLSVAADMVHSGQIQ